MSARRAQLAAERLLESFSVSSVPVDLEAIAARLEIRILHQDLGPEVSGLLVRTAKGVHICVASKQAEFRRRFTIAHELGHHVLRHQFEPGDHVHVDRGNYISQRGARASEGVDPKEIEANQFAANLLMPATLLRREVLACAAGPIMDFHVEQLAKKFKVSEQAMTIRLSATNLL